MAAGPTTVIGFIHRDPAKMPDFVLVFTSAGRLSLTHQHMLMVNGTLKQASALQAGDVLTTADGQTATVVSTETYIGRGAYHIFVDTPTYYAHNNGVGSSPTEAFEVSNLMLWEDWGLDKFQWLYDRALACYTKGNPFNWGREIWENKGTRAKEEAFKC